MLSSSISAILTFLFQVQVPAPHGGFLVLPVVTNGLHWVGAILAGSIIGGVLYGAAMQRRTANNLNSIRQTTTDKEALV